MRLELENYRRHRRTMIEMPDGVTAVLGRNGAGKSTILEALGFALFGAPATRTAKELLRHEHAGPSETVRVTVELELGGQALRIERQLRGKNLVPNATLEADGVVLVAAGAGSNDAATEQVCRRLGMTREAFFTTAVARQRELAGLADATPAERKRRILEMLGVDRIDRAVQQARVRRREAEAQVEAVRSVLEDPQRLAREQEQADLDVQSAQEALLASEAAWKEAGGRLAEAERKVAGLQEQAQVRLEAERALETLRRERAHLAQRTEAEQARLDAARRAAGEAAAFGPTQQAVTEAQAAVDAAREARRQAAAREGALRRLVAEEKAVQDLRQQLEARVVPPEVPEDDAVRRLEQAQRRCSAAEEQAAVAAARVQELRGRHRRLSGLGVDAPCPTCERPLQDHLPRILEEAEQAFTTAQQAQTTAQEQADAARQDREAAQEALQAVRRQRAEADRLRQERRHLEAALEAARERALAAQAEVPPDAAVPDLDPFEAALAEARGRHETRLRLEARAEEAEALQRGLAALQDGLEGCVKKEAEAQRHLERLPDVQPALAEAKADLSAAATAERSAERDLHAARRKAELAGHRAAEATRRREQDARQRAHLHQLQEQGRYWAALAGRAGGGLLDGFRDHLVQRVGPAIAQEASRLLARFTDGRYSEVLLDDAYRLYVTDGGVPYTLERFSGGEADLVHLALRLAVSRLLAERGAAELRFLALDEVFGGLDAERRLLVVGALRELGGLYTQVLLVTHLDALRDALDQALQVEEQDGEARVALLQG